VKILPKTMKGEKGSLVLKTIPVVWQLFEDKKDQRCDYCFKVWVYISWYWLRSCIYFTL